MWAKFLEQEYSYVEDELGHLTQICHQSGAVVKVILETCYLSDQQIAKVCELCVKVKADFVKTSTGFGTGGATVEDICLMKSVVGKRCKIKASGGIKTYDDAIKMIEAGADRLGTSSSVAIMRDL